MIQVVFEEDRQRAAVYDDGKEIGESTYSDANTIWIINYTTTDPAYQGQGLARQLVNAIVQEARVRYIKIMPLCPYAKHLFESSADAYFDVWLGK